MNNPAAISRLKSFTDAPRMIKNPLEVFLEYSKIAGETYRFQFGGLKNTIVSSNPVFIEHVLKTNYENYHKSEIQVKRMGHFLGKGLLTSHGSYWLTQRRLIQQGFHKDVLSGMIHLIYEVLDDCLIRFNDEIKKGPVDISKHMMRMTFSTVSRSMFSTSLTDANITQISDTISTIQKFMVKQIVQPYLNPWFRLTGELGKYESMRHESDQIILNHIRKRRKEKTSHTDMLQILMDAVYEDSGHGMDDTQLLSESMQLLVAGHETSSNVLAWTWYLLCRHPEYIVKIREEVEAVAGDEPLKYNDLPRLELTMQVLDEAMRLYPPFWLVDRVALEDDEAAGVPVRKGSIVIAFIYGVHHSQKYWKDAEQFDPGRFSKENKKFHVPFTHIPFGAGPRRCIGGNYAMMQMLVILTTIISKYDFELSPERNIPANPMIILRPEGGIYMKFRQRRHVPAPLHRE